MKYTTNNERKSKDRTKRDEMERKESKGCNKEGKTKGYSKKKMRQVRTEQGRIGQ